MGIKFYKKNIIDLDNSRPVLSVTDSVASNTGEDFLDFLRNRDNTSGWSTTDSDDTANTVLEVDLKDAHEIDSVIMLQNNFKTFKAEYWDGASWNDFPTAIDETNDSATDNYFEFTLTEIQKFRITIYETITANADKSMTQLILCERIGELSIQPEIEIEHVKMRKTKPYLSGKSFVSTQVGGLEARLRHPSVTTSADQELIEELFDYFGGFLISISGGTTSQYETIRQGYRLQDIYFVQCSNEYEPNFKDGYYKHGMPLDMRLVEVN